MRKRPDAAKLRSGLGKLLAAHAEVDFAYLFGSLAGGMAYHDVEVAVFLRPAPAPATVSDREMDLSVELTLALNVDVDVHILNNASRGFQHAVLQGRPLLVRNQDHLNDFIEELGPEAREFAYLDEFDLWGVLSAHRRRSDM
jgi:predicted nucleotidyltransferase